MEKKLSNRSAMGHLCCHIWERSCLFKYYYIISYIFGHLISSIGLVKLPIGLVLTIFTFDLENDLEGGVQGHQILSHRKRLVELPYSPYHYI